MAYAECTPLATTLRWGAWTSATSGWDCQFFAEDALNGHSPPVTKDFQRWAEILALRVELRLVWNTTLYAVLSAEPQNFSSKPPVNAKLV